MLIELFLIVPKIKNHLLVESFVKIKTGNKSQSKKNQNHPPDKKM
jgi:hypothetical protein